MKIEIKYIGDDLINVIEKFNAFCSNDENSSLGNKYIIQVLNNKLYLLSKRLFVCFSNIDLKDSQYKLVNGELIAIDSEIDMKSITQFDNYEKQILSEENEEFEFNTFSNHNDSEHFLSACGKLVLKDDADIISELKPTKLLVPNEYGLPFLMFVGDNFSAITIEVRI